MAARTHTGTHASHHPRYGREPIKHSVCMLHNEGMRRNVHAVRCVRLSMTEDWSDKSQP